jgi:hypothetical protein
MGQRAMAVAQMFPEPEKGGLGKNSVVTTELNQNQLSRAHAILRWAPDLGNYVVTTESQSPKSTLPQKGDGKNCLVTKEFGGYTS